MYSRSLENPRGPCRLPLFPPSMSGWGSTALVRYAHEFIASALFSIVPDLSTYRLPCRSSIVVGSKKEPNPSKPLISQRPA
jgi:hypothetical protein